MPGWGPHTPADVHYETAGAVRASVGVLATACGAHPERFARKPPEPPELPADSWTNMPGDTPRLLSKTARRCLIQVLGFRRRGARNSPLRLAGVPVRGLSPVPAGPRAGLA